MKAYTSSYTGYVWRNVTVMYEKYTPATFHHLLPVYDASTLSKVYAYGFKSI